MRVSQRNRLSSAAWAVVSCVPSFRNGGLCHWQQLREGIVKNNIEIVSPLALSKQMHHFVVSIITRLSFFFDCFLKRKKSFHFDFTIRYRFLLGSLSHFLSLFPVNWSFVPCLTVPAGLGCTVCALG